MNEQEQNYVAAFNNLFQHKIDGNKMMQARNGSSYEVISVYEPKNKAGNEGHINCTFYSRYSKIHETVYDYNCEIRLHNISNDLIKDIFTNKNYNYSLIETTINELFKIGQEFSFYKEMTPIKNTQLHEQFEKKAYEKVIYTKNATKLTLSSFLTDKHNDSNPKKKVAKLHTRFYVSDNNEIHPVVMLFFPYSTSAEFVMNIQLHPSKTEEQLRTFEELKKEFKMNLEEQFNVVLKRNLKMKQDELDGMTLQEKLNYIPVLEMNRI